MQLKSLMEATLYHLSLAFGLVPFSFRLLKLLEGRSTGLLLPTAGGTTRRAVPTHRRHAGGADLLYADALPLRLVWASDAPDAPVAVDEPARRADVVFGFLRGAGGAEVMLQLRGLLASSEYLPAGALAAATPPAGGLPASALHPRAGCGRGGRGAAAVSAGARAAPSTCRMGHGSCRSATRRGTWSCCATRRDARRRRKPRGRGGGGCGGWGGHTPIFPRA